MMFDLVIAVSVICEDDLEICLGRDIECNKENNFSKRECVVYIVGICILKSFIVWFM